MVFITLGWIAFKAATPAFGGLPDIIGTPLLRATTTNLNGTGVRVAQPEANIGSTPPAFEVNPSDGSVNQPASLFTYTSSLGTATTYPNAVGVESSHANNVAANFYGMVIGVATNVAHVDCYDADYFVNTFIGTNAPAAMPARIVNQSFIFSDPRYETNLQIRIDEQINVDLAYDNYAVRFGTLFVSGAGNGGTVYAAATCYNGIGVGVSDTLASSVGPTLDNGRAKPDISAPGSATSYSTPFVAGAAAVLVQAGLRGDGGGDTNAATDTRTLKAFLLNGALKPTNWTHTASYPLDTHYGAGVLNVFNSYRQLAGGKHGALEQTSVNLLSPHPPGSNAGSIGALSGWDFATLTSSSTQDHISHYYFDLTNSISNATFTVTTTLVWNRQTNQTAVNDLDLFLYDTATTNLIAESISGVDNVEHLYVTGLPAGRYDLQVLKYGGNAGNGNVIPNETYALAFEFFAMPLAIAQDGTNAIVTWPIYPDGFELQSTPSLTTPAWATLNLTRTVTNGTNHVQVPLNSSNQFFRLSRPH